MRQSLVIGNWKMHGSLVANALLLSELNEHLPKLKNTTVVVCPPLAYLPQVLIELADLDSAIKLGAQNVCGQAVDTGAYTGEVSSEMLCDLAVDYCLVGHSERREYYGESDAIVAQKFQHLQAKSITPVLCVGESLEQQAAGSTYDVIAAQMNNVIDAVGIGAFKNAVIAYEPIWAIGTGKTASPEQAQDVHAFIRGLLNEKDSDVAEQLPLLYGGSVKVDNAQQLFSMTDIDGALVGGASLHAESFSLICKAAE